MKSRKEKVVVAMKHGPTWFGLLASLLLFFTNTPLTLSQPGGGPTDPVPAFELDDQAKSMRVQLHFLDRFTAEVESVQVVTGQTHGKETEPPLLRVELLGLQNNLLEEFNAWHPMWGLAEDRRILIPDARGEIYFPFRPDVVRMKVLDVAENLEVVSTDIVDSVHGYCRDYPEDPKCTGVVNRPPSCDGGGPYVMECTGPTTQLGLNGSGCEDPDGDPLSYLWSGPFSAGSATGVTPTVEFTGVGDSAVSLTVSDDFAGKSICSAQVSILDTTPPVISSNAPPSITPPDAPVSFTATAQDLCSSIASVEVTGYSCTTETRKGKPIDKGESCVVEISGPVITVLESGGVGDRINWTVEATDAGGNVSQEQFTINVIGPGN